MAQGFSPRALSGRGKDDGGYGVEIENGLVTGYYPLGAQILLIENGASVPAGTPVGTIIVEKDA